MGSRVLKKIQLISVNINKILVLSETTEDHIKAIFIFTVVL